MLNSEIFGKGIGRLVLFGNFWELIKLQNSFNCNAQNFWIFLGLITALGKVLTYTVIAYAPLNVMNDLK